MVWVRILLSPTVNGHEFSSHLVESGFHPKIRLFSGSISLIFSQYSTLNFWTLSVAAWLLYHIFFYDLVLISAYSDTWPSDSPNFQYKSANNLHNFTRVASRSSATSALTNTSAFVRWLNSLFPLCLRCKFASFCCCSCLFLDDNFTLLQTGWLLWSLASFMANLLSLFFLGEPANMLSLALTTKEYFSGIYCAGSHRIPL